VLLCLFFSRPIPFCPVRQGSRAGSTVPRSGTPLFLTGWVFFPKNCLLTGPSSPLSLPFAESILPFPARTILLLLASFLERRPPFLHAFPPMVAMSLSSSGHFRCVRGPATLYWFSPPPKPRYFDAMISESGFAWLWSETGFAFGLSRGGFANFLLAARRFVTLCVFDCTAFSGFFFAGSLLHYCEFFPRHKRI